MPLRDTRRLTAASDKRGDEFLKAREAWQKAPLSETLRRRCIERSKAYEAALDREIEFLESLEPSAETRFALNRAKIYKRLLARQMAKITSARDQQYPSQEA